MDIIDLRINEEEIDQKLISKIDREKIGALRNKFQTFYEKLSKFTNL